MKSKTGLAVVSLLFLGIAVFCCPPASAKDLMIAGFESGDTSDISTRIGTWSSNPLDSSQGTTMEIIPLYGVMGKTTQEEHVIKITYDVATTGPAFNGVYIKLKDMDLTPYKRISMLIKGDPGKGFTTKFKIELKNEKGQRATCVIDGITDDWQELSIPLQKFKAAGSLRGLSGMSEMDITFDDMTVDSKNGVLYIDEIKLCAE